MNTNKTPNGTQGPPAARGHAAADAAAPSPTTVHAPSSTNTNSNYNNPPAANAAPSPTVSAPPPTGNQDAKVKPTSVEYPPANENEGKVGAFASLPQPILPKPPRPFNVADYDEDEDEKLKSEAKQSMAAASSLPQPEPNRRVTNGLELIDDHGPPLPIGTTEAQLDEAEWGGKPFAKPSGKLEQIKDDDGPHHASTALAASLEATKKIPARRHVEIVNDNAVPINPFEPPRPFNVANYDEGKDAKLKSEAKQVGASKHEDSIIVPTEEDMADGFTLDPAISRDRRTRGDEGGALDLELGGKVEPLQSKEGESEEVLQGDVEPFNSELPVLKAYIVEEESEQDVYLATHVEPTLPWWKQRRFKLFLSAVFAVIAVMAIALGVSMSSSSSADGEPLVAVVVGTSAPTISQAPTISFQPSTSLVPTSIPSVSVRPSFHPSFPPTTTQSPSFTRLESLKIVADDGADYDFFGSSVAVFGDTLVVGAYRDDDKGSVYIYNRDLQTKEWILQQKLVADDGAEYDKFGWSVDIFGDTVVVGATGDDDKESDSGSAYIYSRDTTTKEWILQQKLVADDGAEGDSFGGSVAVFEDTVVVGAHYYGTDKGSDSGSAYIYYRDPTTKEWILQQKLVPDDGAEFTFGLSVAVVGDTVVVGAPFDDDKGFNSGSVYIYSRDTTTKEWILQQKLVADDGAAFDDFGWSVAVVGDTVVVGARGDDKGFNSGSVYIYSRDTTTKEWILQQKLVADDGATQDGFGDSVAVFGDTLVVGAEGYDDKGEYSGSAYIYYRDLQTKEWILQQKLVAVDYFGLSVAVVGDTVVVGASWDTDKGFGSGSVYVYSSSYTRAPSPTPTQTHSLVPSTTVKPSAIPTQTPSLVPSTTVKPSATPTQSSKPSTTVKPSAIPTISFHPTTTPSQSPSFTRLESLKIVADDGADNDLFGDSVAVFGDTLVVGASRDDDKGTNSGSAYIYNRDATTKEWIFQQKLVADDGADIDWFGWSVAVFGDTLVVGAPNSGSAYIYSRDTTTKEWNLQQKLLADDGSAEDSFGSSVAINRDTIVVGASWDNDNGEDSGSAYIYNRDPTTKEWIMQQKLVPDDGAEYDLFGTSVDIYEDTVVVGARSDDDKGEDSGSAYIYNRDPTTKEWIMQQKLVAEDGAAGDNFGGSVAVFGDTLVVGASYDDDKGFDSGSAYIYNRDATNKEWILQQKLVADDGADDDSFGGSVAVFGDTVVVGASYGDDDNDKWSGSAYIYNRDSTTKEWILQQKLVADDGAEDDFFGSSVAVYNGTVVVGATGDDDKGSRSGSVYVYSSSYTRAPTPTPSQSFKPSTTVKPSAIPTQSSRPSTSSSPTKTCYNVTIAVVYDEYPDETSWEIASIGSTGTGVVVESYDELDGEATSHTKDACLFEGEYEFIISDAEGDGICCGFGEGNYNVTSLNGEMIAQGGAFANEDRTRFSIPFTPVQ